VLAAIEKFRPLWWNHLMDAARWLWLPGLAAIVCGLYLYDREILTIPACVWVFPLIAFGMATLLLGAVSPRLPFRRIEVPGAAFLASIAYSVYLSHKLVIHLVSGFCAARQISLLSLPAHLLVEASIYAGGTLLFLAVERPFLQLRHRLTARRDEATCEKPKLEARNSKQ
jgi:peptidoglycan/LPS O-acetylase OafA/YrhL